MRPNLDDLRYEDLSKSPELQDELRESKPEILSAVMYERTGEKRKSTDPNVLEYEIRNSSPIVTNRNFEKYKDQTLIPSCGAINIYQTVENEFFMDLNRRQFLTPKGTVPTYAGFLNTALSKTKISPRREDILAQIKGLESDNGFVETVMRQGVINNKGRFLEPLALFNFPEKVRLEFFDTLHLTVKFADKLLGYAPQIAPKWVLSYEVEFADTKDFHLYLPDFEQPFVKRGIINFEEGLPNVNLLKVYLIHTGCRRDQLTSIHCELGPRNPVTNEQKPLDLPKVFLKVNPDLTIHQPYEPLDVFKTGKRIDPHSLPTLQEVASLTTNIQLTPAVKEYEKAALAGQRNYLDNKLTDAQIKKLLDEED